MIRYLSYFDNVENRQWAVFIQKEEKLEVFEEVTKVTKKKRRNLFQVCDRTNCDKVIYLYVKAYTAKQAETFYAKKILGDSSLRHMIVAEKVVNPEFLRSDVCSMCGYKDIHNIGICPNCDFCSQ